MDQPGTRAIPSLRYLQSVPAFDEISHFIDGDIGPGGGLTWDGRVGTLSEQARIPLLGANEMANRDATEVAGRLARSRYAGEFRAAFGADIFQRPQDALTAAVQALEAFQHTPAEFFPYSSKYDAFLRGDADLTEQEERGAALFKDPAKGNCANCHVTSIKDGVLPSFSDYDYMNAGIPRNPAIAANANRSYYDRGLQGPPRMDHAGDADYCGLFRSPTLRNVALRDAFFHNGVFHTLREVMEFYVQRDTNPEKWYPRNPDGRVHVYDDLPPDCSTQVIERDPPFDRKMGDKPALTDAEIDDVIAFMKTLTDGYEPGTEPAPAVPSRGAGTAPPSAPVGWADPSRFIHDPKAAVESSAEYAWRAFVAVNWPADVRARKADPRRQLGSVGATVWETWENVKDVFLLGGRDPGPWRVGAAAPVAAAATRFDTGLLQASVPARRVVNGVMLTFNPVTDAGHLNETRLNRQAFEYIRTHELFNVQGQVAAYESGRKPSFPADSVEVKAQWRPIDPQQRARYHTTWITLDDGTHRLYGLTALHIASKDLGNWFWATFEHVDNGAGGSTAPAAAAIEGTVWQNYRLRGTMARPVDPDGQPILLANSQLEAGIEHSSSCITCHSRASIGVVNGVPARLSILDERAAPAAGDVSRGYVGMSRPEWFGATYLPLDFVWSLTKAQPRSSP